MANHGNEKRFVKELFITWMALPEPLREPKVIIELPGGKTSTRGATQEEFAKANRVTPATLSRWKKEANFWEEVEAKVKQWGREQLPNVMGALYQGIIKRQGAAETKLFLQWAVNWEEKMQVSDPGVARQIEELRVALKDMITAVGKAK